MTAGFVELLTPLRADPGRAAILLDVDGTLAPITRHASDAAVPESTRSRLTQVSRRYGIVACVSGRRAAEARRIVSIGSLTYIGNHGLERLRPGSSEVELDPDARAWARRVQAFVAAQDLATLDRLRVRAEDKQTIVAFHWRGAPNEETAQAAVGEVAERAQAAGLAIHWGRKVLEVRPPIAFDKGAGIESLLRGTSIATALYAGDDATDLDAFRALTRLVDRGRLTAAVRVGIASEEAPPAVADEADIVVEGTLGINRMFDALLI